MMPIPTASLRSLAYRHHSFARIGYLNSIRAPSLPAAASLDPTKVADYQQLSQICTERTIKLFDHLVVKSFLPVFTAVLGYIFGTRGVEKDNS